MSKNDRNQDVEQEKNWTAITLEEAKKLLAERHEVVFPANDSVDDAGDDDAGVSGESGKSSWM